MRRKDYYGPMNEDTESGFGCTCRGASCLCYDVKPNHYAREAASEKETCHHCGATIKLGRCARCKTNNF